VYDTHKDWSIVGIGNRPIQNPNPEGETFGEPSMMWRGYVRTHDGREFVEIGLTPTHAQQAVLAYYNEVRSRELKRLGLQPKPVKMREQNIDWLSAIIFLLPAWVMSLFTAQDYGLDTEWLPIALAAACSLCAGVYGDRLKHR
jgi:hypothetical protein